MAAVLAALAAAAGAPAMATDTRDGFERVGRYVLARMGTAAMPAEAFAVEKGVADKAGIGDLSEAIAVHRDSIRLHDLLALLIPAGWQLRLEIPRREAVQIIAFHAETSRRRALDDLLRELNLRGAFYPGAGLLLVSKS